MTKTTYVLRRYSTLTYGLGEAVVPGVLLFRAGNYDLTKEQVEARIARMPKDSVIR
jgi:hypothetical protein